MNIAIFGGSKGLGSALAEQTSQKGWAVSVFARSNNTKEKIENYNCDVLSIESINAALVNSNKVFDIVVYCPSLWGESGSLNRSELESFLQTGPFGYQNVCEALFNLNSISEYGVIINISSTAANNSGSIVNPCYSISKRIQDEITSVYQALAKETTVKFTTIQLGTLGEEVYIPTLDVVSYIEWLSQLSTNSFPTSLTLNSRNEL
ncbi:Oxidoreductase [Moritella sp. JT01]|uniref:SDR family oxidoreductase n=1 Tax=Moritella sp. JT01 TaxID=756698 RepID=UPI0007920C78|nr:SDR family oxidoreductase [Moritella sp. JT01]KXO11551.1 Oxidoreductase [Moritella sp. JT01]